MTNMIIAQSFDVMPYRQIKNRQMSDKQIKKLIWQIRYIKN
jgi:hypothetical protein